MHMCVHVHTNEDITILYTFIKINYYSIVSHVNANTCTYMYN